MKLSEMPLTGFDTVQALAVVWAALESLDLDDQDQDQLNTAMAWIGEALGADEEDPAPNKLTVELTFDPNACEDVDAEDYDPLPDFHAIMSYGNDHYNLEDWQIV
jgi:alkylhydroperoxidase family enzyme